MKQRKKLGLDQIFALMKSGLNPSQISKKYDIPKQTLDYNVGKLKKLGCIEKTGYGVWKIIKDLEEVRKQPKDTQPAQIGTSQKQIRGHAFIWTVEFVDYYDWLEIVRNYKKRYRRPKLTFQFLANGKVPRTIFRNRKIWLTKKGMTVYEPLDFLGRSSFQVKGTAVFELDRLIKGLLKELKQKFSPYRFTCSREHYGNVKNELARQYNDQGKKLKVRDEQGTVWFWIDNSSVKGYRPGEAETNNALISRQHQEFWNDHRKHKFGVTPSFVLNGFEQINAAVAQNTANLDYHAENLKSHVRAVQELGEGVNRLTAVIERMEARPKLNQQIKDYFPGDFKINLGLEK